MADVTDDATDTELKTTETAIAEVRNRAGMPVGTPGDCDCCGEWSGRLVQGACAPCRDKHRLP